MCIRDSLRIALPARGAAPRHRGLRHAPARIHGLPLPDPRHRRGGLRGLVAVSYTHLELLKAGASRDRLEAKVFGGGAVLSAMQQMNIGERNGQFVLNYLRTEGIPVKAQDLGDVHARRINYFPRDGRVMVRKMAPHHQLSLIHI